MTKPTEPDQSAGGMENIYVFHTGKLRGMAIRLKDGDLCFYSPLKGMHEKQVGQLRSLGRVSYLLAPNHYHSRGLGECHRLFPDARLVCPPDARQRLSKLTGLAFENLDDLCQALPQNMQLLSPPGLKTGEVWLDIVSSDQRIWLVTDAFSASPLDSTAADALPCLLKTFPNYAVADMRVYATWVRQQILRQAPTMLISCHGPPAVGVKLGPAMLKLLDDVM